MTTEQNLTLNIPDLSPSIIISPASEMFQGIMLLGKRLLFTGDVDCCSDQANEIRERNIGDQREADRSCFRDGIVSEYLNVDHLSDSPSADRDGDGQNEKNDGDKNEIIQERDLEVQAFARQIIVDNDIHLKQKSPAQSFGHGSLLTPVYQDGFPELLQMRSNQHTSGINASNL